LSAVDFISIYFTPNNCVIATGARCRLFWWPEQHEISRQYQKPGALRSFIHEKQCFACSVSSDSSDWK
jgi:hypothetical protein